jgi:tetratricopeptide (TPR) repeat protein
MADLKAILELLIEIGPIWGPPILLGGTVYWRLRYRWVYGGVRGFRIVWDRGILFIILAAAVVLPSYYHIRHRYWGLPDPFKQGEIGILVGEVPGDTNQDQQAAYTRGIRELAHNTPELKSFVRVEMLDRTLPPDPEKQHATALQWGRWLHAAFVLRPNVVEGVQEPWITVVDQPLFSRVDAPLGKFGSPMLANLDQLPLPSDLLLLARCTLALSLYNRSFFSEAASLLEQVLASPSLPVAAPARPTLNLVLANCRMSLGQFDKAVETYKTSLALDPNYAAAYNNLGIALARTGQPAAAVTEYQKAILLKPDFAEAHNNLGITYSEGGQVGPAIPEFREAIRLEPSFAEPHYNLGILLYDKGLLDEAIAQYREAIRLKPGYAKAHNNLGNVLLTEDHYDAAIAEYREALRLKPDFAEAHSNLGLALGSKGDWDGEIREMQGAIRLKPDYAAAHNNLGWALEQKGDRRTALDEYRMAYELDPKNGTIGDNYERLLRELKK